MPDKGKGKDKESQMDGLDSDNPCVSKRAAPTPSYLTHPLACLPSLPTDSPTPSLPARYRLASISQHPRACALQSCMQRTWDQEKCSAELRALYVCCSKLYQQKGTSTEVDACPLPEVLRGKLRGLGEEARF